MRTVFVDDDTPTACDVRLWDTGGDIVTETKVSTDREMLQKVMRLLARNRWPGRRVSDEQWLALENEIILHFEATEKHEAFAEIEQRFLDWHDANPDRMCAEFPGWPELCRLQKEISHVRL